MGSPAVQPNVTMKVGRDDSIQVWLNGEVVFRNAADRGADGYQDTFNVNLAEGVNPLLIATYEGGGSWSMFAGIDADFAVHTDLPHVVSTFPADGAVNVPTGILN